MVKKDVNSILKLSEVKDFLNVKSEINDFFYYHYTSHKFNPTESPTRLNVFTVGICTQVSIDIGIGIKRLTLNSNELMTILPMQIIQIHAVSSDFEFMAITISDDFMESLQIDTSKIFNLYLFVEENPLLKIDNDEVLRQLLAFYSNLNAMSRYSSVYYYKEIIQYSVYAFLYGIVSFYKQMTTQTAQSLMPDNNNLFKRFLSLLQKHFKEERSVGFYADKLCVTPKYLTTYIKKISNNTAGAFIQEIVILEAKVLLRLSETNIQMVSNELHFPDQSSFGKFFKKHVGVSPKEYKRGIRS